MGKVAPDAMIDAALSYVGGSLSQLVCSSSPTTWAEATATYCLATAVMSAGDFVNADAGGGGRQCTIASKLAQAITATGTANHVALCLAAGSTLRYVTTCTSQALTSGGTVDIPAHLITIGDPT
jgi:hypothetical protein